METIEQLYELYGDRCIDLPKHAHLMNTHTFKYSYFGSSLPEEFKDIEVTEKGKLSTLDAQLTFGGVYVVETFYQGALHPENCLVLCGCYEFKHGGGGGSLAKFSRLPKV